MGRRLDRPRHRPPQKLEIKTSLTPPKVGLGSFPKHEIPVPPSERLKERINQIVGRRKHYPSLFSASVTRKNAKTYSRLRVRKLVVGGTPAPVNFIVRKAVKASSRAVIDTYGINLLEIADKPESIRTLGLLVAAHAFMEARRQLPFGKVSDHDILDVISKTPIDYNITASGKVTTSASSNTGERRVVTTEDGHTIVMDFDYASSTKDGNTYIKINTVNVYNIFSTVNQFNNNPKYVLNEVASKIPELVKAIEQTEPSLVELSPEIKKMIEEAKKARADMEAKKKKNQSEKEKENQKEEEKKEDIEKKEKKETHPEDDDKEDAKNDVADDETLNSDAEQPKK
ncbi:MAG: hypothetical protein IJK78_10730 [Bacteroidales bacterium]|nr:hypothetical protein [Bacteroidales bacterium]